MTTLPPSSDAGEHLRYVYITRVRCPACYSANIKTQKTVDNGDESFYRESKCKVCGHNFIVVVE